MKKLFTFILALVLAFSFTACGSTASEGVPGQPSTQKTSFSESEIVEAATQLREDCISASSADDYDTFASKFINTDESAVRSNYDSFASSYSSYDQHFTVYIGSYNGYYAVSYTDAVVSGMYPNFNTKRYNLAMIITHTDDGWKYDLGQEANDAFVNSVYAALPDGFEEAKNNGLNHTVFETGNYMYLNTNNVVNGDFGAVLLNLWQDTEGNMYAGILLNNGTTGNRTAQNINLTLTDATIGTIFDGVLGSETVLSSSAKYVIFTIPADQVLTGTAVWTSIKSNIKHNNI